MSYTSHHWPSKVQCHDLRHHATKKALGHSQVAVLGYSCALNGLGTLLFSFLDQPDAFFFFIKHFWMSFWTSSLPPLLELGVSFFEVFPKPRVLHGPTAAVPRRRSPRLLAVERGPTDASCFRPRSKRLDRSKNGARVERPEHGLSFSLS